MIDISIFRDNEGRAFKVSVRDHADPVVCSAVSVLLLNTVNSIEAFTDAQFSYEADPDGGDSVFTITGFDKDRKAELLMNSLVLGYKSVEESYKDEIKVQDQGGVLNVKD